MTEIEAEIELKAIAVEQKREDDEDAADSEPSVDLTKKSAANGVLQVIATSQIIQGIKHCEDKEYAKAMRILRKNTENIGTVNWCRMVLFNSYATFFHCSKLYFLNKELAKRETQACCGGKPNPYLNAVKEMRELVRKSLQDCYEVARTILDAEKSVNGDELDLVCQMCFSIMYLGNAHQLEEEKFMDKALGLAAVWADKRNSVLANTEKSIMESKRHEDPLKKMKGSMEQLSHDIKKLSKSVQDQGDPNATPRNQ